MSLTRTLIGKHPTSGQPLYHYQQGDDKTTSLLFTGKGTGTVTCKDGTTYAVDAEVIECASLAHAHEVAHHIGVQAEETGIYDVPAEENEGVPIPFLHGPCPHCGAGVPFRACSDPECNHVVRFTSREAEVAHRAAQSKRGAKR